MIEEEEAQHDPTDLGRGLFEVSEEGEQEEEEELEEESESAGFSITLTADPTAVDDSDDVVTGEDSAGEDAAAGEETVAETDQDEGEACKFTSNLSLRVTDGSIVYRLFVVTALRKESIWGDEESGVM